ncbi:hypothetical protein ACCH70_004402 [Vibrio vulnificus]|nr:hypothetical protein [Vibrio vulnificus]EGR0209328.1 hypothetical protein [Vibrio vulnificus]EHH0685073.1 hypothetical protein [Vibrio vulnificus]EHI9279549.1 hypothetical protein [Vibrio vulnificus]EHK9005384.1 hypothetical protein [Vibrio vulnificus]
MNLLGNPYFIQFGVPLITVGLSIFIKYVTRNDRHSGFKKEDVAVGLDLAVTALLIFITGSSQLTASLPADNPPVEMVNKLASVPWIIMAFIIGIWGMSTLVRKLGWESDDKLKVFWGIVVPDVFGLAVLLFVVNWI